MSQSPALHPVARDSRLWVRGDDDEGSTFFTEALGRPPTVYRERIIGSGTRLLRSWDPNRSKFAAALRNGWDGSVPQPSQRWLYLGAATGTTSSHVADLVGPAGAVYAVERSVRPFVRLLSVAERYPNLLPILADARFPEEYVGSVPAVDGVYVDVAQPDQVEIALENARRFLRTDGSLLLALKTSSMGRSRSARQHLLAAETGVSGSFDVSDSLGLEPFHRRHFLIGARPKRAPGATDAGPARFRTGSARRVGPRR